MLSELGYKALADYETRIRKRARQVLDQLEREDRIGIVMLGRPYHHDPGLNHEIMEEFQKLDYPILSQNTLPLDEDMLERLFGCLEELVFLQHQSQRYGRRSLRPGIQIL
jgi:predicted nucleotide-binding protein (sugar kinase/HSP70/actin superfamily)